MAPASEAPDMPSSRDDAGQRGHARRAGDFAAHLLACVRNKFDDPSVDPSRARSMRECAASLSCISRAGADSSVDELRAYGCMVRKTESESPLPHEPGASDSVDGASPETPDGSIIPSGSQGIGKTSCAGQDDDHAPCQWRGAQTGGR